MAVDPPRILVLRALGLGDLLTAVPALRGLREAYDDHAIVLATPAYLEPLVRLGGLADTVMSAAGLAGLPWQGPAPSVAVNLHGRGPQSHRLLLDLDPGWLVSFGNTAAGHDGPPWCEGEHEVWRWCRLLHAYGLPAHPARLDLPVPGCAPPVSGATVVHPGAGRVDKRWGANRFAQVAAELERAGHFVVITGDASERPLATSVAHSAALPAGRVLAGKLNLLDLAALVASARLVICGDTGIGHLASAFATPSVLLFGPEHPDRWGPPARPQHVVVHRADGDLAAISPDRVMAVVHELG